MHTEGHPLMEKVQFFEWCERQSRRFELANGRPILPDEQSRAHSAICTNLVFQLASMLDTRRYSVIGGRFALETGPRSIRLPDVMVEPHIADNAISATDALLLVEVLSPSTMHIDFHEKLDEYKGLAALGTYLICAQDDARVWMWTRSESVWPDASEVLEGLDAAVQVPILGIALPLADIYRNIDLR
jgi:Uma2 family endonuclease